MNENKNLPQADSTTKGSSVDGGYYLNGYRIPYGGYPFQNAVPTYTPPLPENFRLALAILGEKSVSPTLRKKAEAILVKALMP